MIPKLHNNLKRKTAESAVNRAFSAVKFCIIFGNYIDDGYSGTNFDRPGVQKILDDAKSGKINLILVKDLSRFGRNYIEVGQYIDYIFPSFNIRFIALSDNVDTLDRNSTAMDLMPIMNLVSALYGQNPKATYLPIFIKSVTSQVMLFFFSEVCVFCLVWYSTDRIHIPRDDA